MTGRPRLSKRTEAGLDPRPHVQRPDRDLRLVRIAIYREVIARVLDRKPCCACNDASVDGAHTLAVGEKLNGDFVWLSRVVAAVRWCADNLDIAYSDLVKVLIALRAWNHHGASTRRRRTREIWGC